MLQSKPVACVNIFKFLKEQRLFKDGLAKRTQLALIK